MTSELESALLATMKASEVLRAGFGAEHAITYKGEVDFVTEVDKEAEWVIREELLGTFPTHGMLAEEGGELAGEGDARWIVDPLTELPTMRTGCPSSASPWRSRGRPRRWSLGWCTTRGERPSSPSGAEAPH